MPCRKKAKGQREMNYLLVSVRLDALVELAGKARLVDAQVAERPKARARVPDRAREDTPAARKTPPSVARRSAISSSSSRRSAEANWSVSPIRRRTRPTSD